ncbi:XdhC family protein [Paracoccus aurantiacus]|uniref:XdhC family protein n=1 Tax=Paracoccus aurantiacus TaxID=2599412 RepID=UPI00164C6B3B|nr:XdhC family protein [Paracoccus aurantiacus]
MKDATSSHDLQGAKGVAQSAVICESDFPVQAIAPDAALAIITGIEGASYRPLGAGMVIDNDGHRTGSLSSGCLERDVALHAQAVLNDGKPRALRYGHGSPFVDITLPCGGSLDIAVIPPPDQQLLDRTCKQLAAREPARITLLPDGQLTDAPVPNGLTIHIRPQPRLVVFGKGPEAACFARISQQAGYPVKLFSPDAETLAEAGFGSELTGIDWPADLSLDPYTAVTLFFHDHDREPALLAHALQSPAFLIGAQGSLRAHERRCAALKQLGIADEMIARLASPFGLIPSTRDPRTLAVSVLAQVLERAAANQAP